MCGVAGIRRFDGAPADPALLRKMASQLRHRGPDDEGLMICGSVGLAHRRLSIIDVDGSRQPMSSIDGRLHVCFNGEILNYRELRRALPYPYRTAGDTEVLLASFARYGAASVERLRGQFAYAIYSQADDSLWLFRDRLGILPLYYYSDDRMFVFASEIKAILSVLPQYDVNLESLGAYLTTRSVPAPETLFAGIRKLPAASLLRVPSRPPLGHPTSYWALPTGRARSVSPGEAADELDSHLTVAVARNLVADVPVGAYLSGGIDSSVIVAKMRQLAPAQEINTFTASFGDPRFDETPDARRVSRLCRTEHHEIEISPATFVELWPNLTWHRDAPVSEASDIALFRLAERASEDVRVVLSGEGSDELLAGYPKHRFARVTELCGLVPHSIRGPLGVFIESSLPVRAARPRIAVRALSEPSLEARLDGWFAPFTARERAQLLGASRSHRSADGYARQRDALSRMLAYDMTGWLSDNLLERSDRMSMAASVELRPPFLDAELVEWAFALSSRLKRRHGIGKWILREVARRYLPTDVIERRKVGFRVPLDEWFRGQLRGHVHDMLLSSDSFVTQVFPRDRLITLLQRHDRRRASEELRLWTLLSLEAWHRTFFRTSPLHSVAGVESPLESLGAVAT